MIQKRGYVVSAARSISLGFSFEVIPKRRSAKGFVSKEQEMGKLLQFPRPKNNPRFEFDEVLAKLKDIFRPAINIKKGDQHAQVHSSGLSTTER